MGILSWFRHRREAALGKEDFDVPEEALVRAEKPQGWVDKEDYSTDGRYIAVDSKEAMQAFLYKVDGFHDALLREVAVVHRGWVDTEGSMHGDVEPWDARLIFHSQFVDCAYIELILRGVRQFRIEHNMDLDPGLGSVADKGIKMYFGGNYGKEEFVFAADTMKYRIAGRELLGEELCAVHPIELSDEHELGSSVTRRSPHSPY